MDNKPFPTDTSLDGASRRAASDPRQPCPARTSDPVLLLLHQKSSSAGAVGEWLLNQGYTLDIKRPTLGEQLPSTLEKHAGLIVFGGPMSANDETREIKQEIDWLTLALTEKTPYLGICLGAQMMVRQLGGEVFTHDKKMVEIGYHPVMATTDGKNLIGEWPERFFQWHKEGFSLPSQAQALATGQRFKNQAYCYDDHVYGVQFHPEITAPIIEQWSLTAGHMLTKKGAHIMERLLADHQKYGQAQQEWLHHFMSHWTSLIRTR